MAPVENFVKTDFHTLLHRLWYSSFVTGLRHSAGFRYSLGAILVGLALARVLHSASLYAYSSVKVQADLPGGTKLSAPAANLIEDPKAVVGGALFGAPVTMTKQPAENILPVKNFKLQGTLESGIDTARALIEVQGEGIREYCAAGSACTRGECSCSVQNINITAIAKEFIWLKTGTARYKLSIGQSTADILNATAQQSIPGEKTQATANQPVVSQTISAEEIRRILDGKEGPLLKGNFGPYLVNGNIEGYQIIQIPAEHIFARLGGKNGDILRRVNGYPLTGLERVLDLMKALPTMPAIKIDIERGGKDITYDFQIRK